MFKFRAGAEYIILENHWNKNLQTILDSDSSLFTVIYNDKDYSLYKVNNKNNE